MVEGQKVSNKWGPISGSPIVNVSRVKRPQQITRLCKFFWKKSKSKSNKLLFFTVTLYTFGYKKEPTQLQTNYLLTFWEK